MAAKNANAKAWNITPSYDGLRWSAWPAGDKPEPTLPSWWSAINVGEWGSISGTSLTASGVGWSGTAPGGTGGYEMTMLAYSGGVLNTTGIWRGGVFVPGTFLIIWGGGHGDYGGNEQYAFGPLDSGTPTWSRLTDPTLPAIVNVARSGGYPVSRHTYDCIGYLSATNQMISGGIGGAYSAAGNFNVCDLFDFDTDPGSGNPWSTADTGSPAFNVAAANGAQDAVSGVDDATGAFWIVGAGNVQAIGRYLVGSGWTSWSPFDNPDLPSNCKAAVAGSITVMAFVTATGGVRAIDLRNSPPTLYTPTTTGTGPGAMISLEWDVVGGRFVGRATTGGKTVWFLTPSASPYAGGTAWTWSSTTPSGGVTPPAEDGTGTHGRLRMVTLEGGRGLLYVPGPVDNAQFYRMT